MKWCIYKHTNIVNGKVYIGQTHQTPKERWQYGNGYKDNKYFYNAIRKYGWNKGFTHEILEKNILSQKEANDKEIFYIEKFRSFVGFKNCKGYNLTKGGDNHEHLGIYVLQINIKTLEIIGTYPTIRHAENVTKIDHSQIGRCCMKKQTTAGGYYWCYQKNWNNNWSPRLNRKCGTRYKVFQIDKYTLKIINEFNSTVEAGLCVGKAPSQISLCCNKKGYSTAAGYFWCYQKDYLYWKPKINKNELKQRAIIRINIKDTNERSEYTSISAAAKSNKITPEAIAHCCDGVVSTSAGYYWCYKSKIKEWLPRKNKVKQEIICVETKKIYQSITDAAKDLKISKTYLGRACKDGGLVCGGYHWCYLKNYSKNYIPREKINNSRKVVCVETGMTFKSQADASKYLHRDPSSLIEAIKNKTKCGGYHWKYVE